MSLRDETDVSMKDFRKLEIWNRSHALALATYGATKPFPKDEIFGLTSQIRAISDTCRGHPMIRSWLSSHKSNACWAHFHAALRLIADS